MPSPKSGIISTLADAEFTSRSIARARSSAWGRWYLSPREDEYEADDEREDGGISDDGSDSEDDSDSGSSSSSEDDDEEKENIDDSDADSFSLTQSLVGSTLIDPDCADSADEADGASGFWNDAANVDGPADPSSHIQAAYPTSSSPSLDGTTLCDSDSQEDERNGDLGQEVPSDDSSSDTSRTSQESLSSSSTTSSDDSEDEDEVVGAFAADSDDSDVTPTENWWFNDESAPDALTSQDSDPEDSGPEEDSAAETLSPPQDADDNGPVGAELRRLRPTTASSRRMVMRMGSCTSTTMVKIMSRRHPAHSKTSTRR